jgi:PAS domain S-box-containing protein
MVDATVPDTLENSMRNFLLSTSACEAQRALSWRARLSKVLPPSLLDGRCARAAHARGADAHTALALAGHDLRTPTHSIQASAMLLAQNAEVSADGDAQALIKHIECSCSLLNTMVSNVLKLKQMQRGTAVSLACRGFDPRSVIVAATANAQSLFPTRRVALVGDEEGSRTCAGAPAVALPAAVFGDEDKLGECITNMLLTALRLSSWEAEGSVQLFASCEDAASYGDGRMVLRVSADVPGRPLTRKECNVLLTPFGLAPSDKGGGTGLALHVARGTAQAMGGDLKLEPRGGAEGGTRIAMHVQLLATASAAASLGAPPPSESQSPSASSAPSSPSTPTQQLEAAPRCAAPELTSRMLECLMTTSDDVFSVCQADGQRIVYVSPNVERVSGGRTAAGLIGRPLSELVHPDDRSALVTALTAAFASEQKPVLLHYRRLVADGGSVATEAAGCMSDGLLFLVCRDVRARMATEAALRAFALATSHDLREPCNSVLVSTSLLQRRACVAASADCRFLVGAICSACGLLLGIVTNVLTARQLEAGALTLNHVLFSPAELIDAVLQACRSGCNTASMAGIAWERGLGDLVPAVVEGDRDRLAQVLQNLVRERLRASFPRCAQTDIEPDRTRRSATL